MDGMKPLEKRHRPPRLPNYDYRTPGYYFVTTNALRRNQDIFATPNDAVVPAALGGPLQNIPAAWQEKEVHP